MIDVPPGVESRRDLGNGDDQNAFKSSLSAFDLKIYARAGLSEQDAYNWANHGIPPYQAVGYRSAGLNLDEAVSFWRAGITGGHVRSGDLDTLHTRARSIEEAVAPLELRLPGLLEELQPREIVALADAIRVGYTTDTIADWIEADGPISEITGWLASGIPPSPARRLSIRHYLPPERTKLEKFESNGFRSQEAVPWISNGIPPRRAKAWAKRSFSAEEAVGWISKGLSPDAAARARQYPSPIEVFAPPDPPSNEPSIDPNLGWTSGELEPLPLSELRGILLRDFQTQPTGRTRASLRKQILIEQQKSVDRGELRWLSWGDNVILYDLGIARAGRKLVKTLERVTSIGDVIRLVNQDNPAADDALTFLWDLWDNGDGCEALGIEDNSDLIEEVSSVMDLLQAIPPETPLNLSNLDDEGIELRFFDALDPWTMGVPFLVIDRYYYEEFGLVNSWMTASAAGIGDIRKTLQALGWRLRKGRCYDLNGLDIL